MNISQTIPIYKIDSLDNGLNPLTLSVYESSLRLFISFLGDPDVTNITEDSINHFFGFLRHKYKPVRCDNGETLSTASLHRYWKAIRSYCKWASKKYKIPQADANVQMPFHNNKEILPYTELQVQKMLQASQESVPVNKLDTKTYIFVPHYKIRNRAIIFVLLDTAIRPGEFCRLRISDFDPDAGTLQILPHSIGKTLPRVIPIQSKTKRALKTYLQERSEIKPTDFLFIGLNGEAMTRHSLLTLISHLGAKANIQHATPYRFRHTFAIQYFRNNGDIETLKYIMGHVSLKMLKRYMSLSNTDIQAAHRRASPVDNWHL